MKTKIALITLLVAVSIALTAHAAIPHFINFQGKATTTDGTPLDGAHKLTFRIYDAVTGGNREWEEEHATAAVTNGIFQVSLGSVTSLDLDFEEEYWISVEVGADGEMSPRSRLAATGYAYKAEEAEHAETASIISLPFYLQGFELEYENPVAIKVKPGAVDIDGRILSASSYSGSIDITQSGNYISGHDNPSPWIYVYLYNSDNQVAYKLADVAPDKADHLGSADGTKRYYIQDNVAYRCIGAAKKDGANLASFFQRGNLIMWDKPVNITRAVSGGTWSAATSCLDGMPAVSTMGIFGVQSTQRNAEEIGIWIKPNGSSWAVDIENGMVSNQGSSAVSTGSAGAQRWCATDSLQKIQYYNHGGDSSCAIDVEGYVLNIR